MIYFILALDGSNYIKIGTTIRLTEQLKQLTVLTKDEGSKIDDVKERPL